jgi:tetratricopeptide (TPR) repeat protein
MNQIHYPKRGPLQVIVHMVTAVAILLIPGCATRPSKAPHLYYNDLGHASFEKADYRTAVDQYKQATQYAPNDHVIWSNLGSAYRRLNDRTNALAAYNRSLSIETQYEPARYWRAIVYFDEQNYDKAIVDFDKVIRSQQYGKDALTLRGWSYFKKRLYKEAQQDFSSAIQADAGNESALRGRAWISYDNGDFRGAIRDFNKALESINKENTVALFDALIGKAYAYLGVGDKVSAVDLAQQAVAMDKNKSWHLTLIYYLSGDKKRAWEFRGGEGTLSIDVKDHKKGERSGAEITRVDDRSGRAAEHGLLEGDIIVAINAAPVKGQNDFWNSIKPLSPGTTAELAVIREGKERRMTVPISSVEPTLLSHSFAAPILKARQPVNAGGAVEQVATSSTQPTKNNARPETNRLEDELQ